MVIWTEWDSEVFALFFVESDVVGLFEKDKGAAEDSFEMSDMMIEIANN